ncbi:MAG: hypothetical protein RL662_1475 [Bacteroidota bacterium]|jgi:hypothetical protein
MQLPDNIDIDHPERYVLTIRITSDTFAFCIYEPHLELDYYYSEMSFVVNGEGENNIQQIVLDSEFLSLPYAEVNVIFVSKDYDLVPNYIIKKDKKELLYNFTHHLPAKQILYCPDSIQQVSTVYNTDQPVYTFLARNLYNPQFYHHSNLLMQYLEERNKEMGNISKMYLNFHPGFVDIFCYNPSSLILHAITLQNQTERNLAYFLLSIWDKCKFDQTKDYLFILNDPQNVNIYSISVLSEYIRYIGHVNIVNELAIVNKSETWRGLPLDLLILASK